VPLRQTVKDWNAILTLFFSSSSNKTGGNFKGKFLHLLTLRIRLTDLKLTSPTLFQRHLLVFNRSDFLNKPEEFNFQSPLLVWLDLTRNLLQLTELPRHLTQFYFRSRSHPDFFYNRAINLA
jgi:hypothetical protein